MPWQRFVILLDLVMLLALKTTNTNQQQTSLLNPPCSSKNTNLLDVAALPRKD